MGAMLLFAALPLLTQLLEAAPMATSSSAPPAHAANAATAPCGRRAAAASAAAASSSEQPRRAQRTTRLATTLLMNPDASLDRFLATDFNNLRRVCDHITLYADHADGALAYSEFFNRERALGKHPFDLVRMVNVDAKLSASKDGSHAASVGKSSPVAKAASNGVADSTADAAADAANDADRASPHAATLPAAASPAAAPTAAAPPHDAGVVARGGSGGDKRGRPAAVVHIELGHVQRVEQMDASMGAEATSIEASNVEVVTAEPAPLQTGTLRDAQAAGRLRTGLTARSLKLRRTLTSLRRSLTDYGDDDSMQQRRHQYGTRGVVRGAPPLAPPGQRLAPLDLDVIDVSWMDNNVHEMRHNFFNLNRWMIDDIREVILTQRRARLRTARMTHRFTNVWSFLAAPRHVVNP